LTWVVATPVQQHGAVVEESIMVMLGLGMVLHALTSLPVKEVIDDGVQACTYTGWLFLDPQELPGGGVVLPEVTRNQERHVRVAEFHGELVTDIGCSEEVSPFIAWFAVICSTHELYTLQHESDVQQMLAIH
jgi:hypothetical protein